MTIRVVVVVVIVAFFSAILPLEEAATMRSSDGASVSVSSVSVSSFSAFAVSVSASLGRRVRRRRVSREPAASQSSHLPRVPLLEIHPQFFSTSFQSRVQVINLAFGVAELVKRRAVRAFLRVNLRARLRLLRLRIRVHIRIHDVRDVRDVRVRAPETSASVRFPPSIMCLATRLRSTRLFTASMLARAPFTVSPSVLARAHLSRSTALFSSMAPISAYAPRNSSYAAARSDASASAGSRGIGPANAGDEEDDEGEGEDFGESERRLAPSPSPPRTVDERILISTSRLRTVSARRAISARNASSPAPGRTSSASGTLPGTFSIVRSPRRARRTNSRKIRIAALIFSIDAPRSRSFEFVSASSPSTPSPPSSPPPALQYASTSRSQSIDLALGEVSSSIVLPAEQSQLVPQLSVFLFQSLDDEVRVEFLVHLEFVGDARDALREATRADPLEKVFSLGTRRRHHHRATIPARGNRGASSSSWSRGKGCAIAAPLRALLERHHHLLERVKGEVDVLRLLEDLPRDASLGDALRPGEIHQAHLSATHEIAAVLATFDRHGEDAVRTRRREVHRGLGDGAVGVAQEEEVERVLLRLRARRCTLQLTARTSPSSSSWRVTFGKVLQRLGLVVGVEEIVRLVVVHLDVRDVDGVSRVGALGDLGVESRTARGMMPRSTYRSAPPVMVNVLPLPVWP